MFMKDPLFLMASDSKRLLAVFANSKRSSGQDIAGIYRDVAHWIATLPYPLAVGYLEMQARKRGFPDFANRISTIPLSRTWAVPWALWTPPASSRTLANRASQISCLSTGTLADNKTVALVGRESGSVEIWDITTGDKIAQWSPQGVEVVHKLALGQVDNHDVVIASWLNSVLGTFDLVTEKEVITKPRKDKLDGSDIQALCSATRHGQAVCITSHEADYLTMWELPALAPMLARRRAGAIYELHLIEEDGRSMLLGTGDSYGDSWELGEDIDWRQTSKHASTLHLLSLEDLSVIWEDASEREGLFQTVHRTQYLGHHLIVGYRVITQAIEIWDIGERRKVSHIELSAGRCWLYNFRNSLHLAWEWNGEFLAVPLLPIPENGKFALQAQRKGSPVKIQGNQFSTIETVQNRAVVLSAALDEVRVWDFEDLLDECFRNDVSLKDSSHMVGAAQHVNALATTPRRPAELYVGTFDKVMALNLADGRIAWEKDLESGKRVQRIITIGDRDEIYVADGGGTMYTLDISSRGTITQVIKTGTVLQAMEVLEWGGRPIAFATVQQDRVWSVRAWDLEAGTELSTNDAYRLRFGQEDKILYGLAVHGNEDSIRIAFASRYGKVMVANFSAKVPEMRAHGYLKEWHVPNAGNEYTTSMACTSGEGEVLLAAGTENGHLVIWDFYGGEVRAARANAHVGSVNSLRFTGTADDRRLLSAGVDGIARIWNAQLEELLFVDIGEAISTATWAEGDQFVVGGVTGTLTVRLKGDRLRRFDIRE
jgi:WD40 repeat protein